MSLPILLILWVIVGVAAGAIANRLIRPKMPRDIRLDIGVSLFGALAAGIIFYILDIPRVEHFTIWSCIAALAGSAVVLFLMMIYVGFSDQAVQINRGGKDKL